MKRKWIVISLVVLIVGFLASGFYNGLTVTKYIIHSDKITNQVRIVLITDLHSNMYGSGQSKLINRIIAQDPDIIALAGDIMDDVQPDSAAIEFLEGITDKYPCFYVTGNHEFWSGRVDEQKDIFRSYGVVVLEGDRVDIDINGQSLTILGVDDPAGFGFNEHLEEVGGAVDTDRYSILLSHRPERFETYARYDFDLVLSGHAHGGQWRIPLLLPHGVFAPDQGFFPTYTVGIYESNGTKMLVSRGLALESTSWPRIFNPPELVVIDLVP